MVTKAVASSCAVWFCEMQLVNGLPPVLVVSSATLVTTGWMYTCTALLEATPLALAVMVATSETPVGRQVV